MVTQTIIGIAVLALLIYRQRRTAGAAGLRLAAIIGAIGLIETYQFLKHHAARLGGTAWASSDWSCTQRIWLGAARSWRGARDGPWRADRRAGSRPASYRDGHPAAGRASRPTAGP